MIVDPYKVYNIYLVIKYPVLYFTLSLERSKYSA